MGSLLIKNARIINEGETRNGHVLCVDERIKRVFYDGDPELSGYQQPDVLDAGNKILMPGVIDDQVHFREPGLTHKGDIASESKAAVAGGITSYMEMPNTSPPATTIELLDDKFEIAARSSLANFSFYLGATNDNLHELLRADPSRVCGIKVFMGSSTGNMLVDDDAALRSLFSRVKIPVAVHCEDETIIQANTLAHRMKYGENIPVVMHPAIRSEEACYKSSSYAVELAREYGTRLHVLHISTAKELDLFKSLAGSERSNITCEVCIHHLWFDQSDYARLGNRIKWNPAVKTADDRKALIKGIIEDTVDVIATDHAPHTGEEKSNLYLKAPSGGPMVQHSLVVMMEMVRKGVISPEKVVEKMCHAPADLFSLSERGYIREGYYADLVLVDDNSAWTVSGDNLYYKCGWSPLEGQTFSSRVTHTIINGHVVYDNGIFDPVPRSKMLIFKR